MGVCGAAACCARHARIHPHRESDYRVPCSDRSRTPVWYPVTSRVKRRQKRPRQIRQGERRDESKGADFSSCLSADGSVLLRVSTCVWACVRVCVCACLWFDARDSDPSRLRDVSGCGGHCCGQQSPGFGCACVHGVDWLSFVLCMCRHMKRRSAARSCRSCVFACVCIQSDH